MSKNYKRIILITFLIAIFFFGKWAWGVMPKYEIVEEMTDRWDYCYSASYGKKCRNHFSPLNSGLEIKQFYCSEMLYDDIYDIKGTGTCYIKYLKRK